MRRSRFLVSLAAVCLPLFLSSCHRGGGGGSAPLRSALAITNPTTTAFTAARREAYPKRLDSVVVRNTGGSPVFFQLDEPSGVLAATPAFGLLVPGAEQRIDVDLLGYTHASPVLSLHASYTAASQDPLVVPFAFEINGGPPPDLQGVVEVTAPTKLRHLLTPQDLYPKDLDFLVLKNTAASGPAIRYEVRSSSESVVAVQGSPASAGPQDGEDCCHCCCDHGGVVGYLKPGQERLIDIRALDGNFAAATISVAMGYAILGARTAVKLGYELVNASPPSLAVLGILGVLTASNPSAVQRFWSAVLLSVVGVSVMHSKGALPWNRVPALLFTEIAVLGLLSITLDIALLHTNFWRSKQQPEAVVNFPPGQGPNGFTIHPDNEVDMLPGEYHYFHMTMAEDIPIQDPEPKNRYVFSFVADADGLSNNNWVPDPAFPADFFKDTDRWYQITYDRTAGWHLTVTRVNAGGRTTTQVSSAARAIIQGKAIVLVVPAAEFAVSKPSWRATSFCHQGDFGLNAPYVWSGDVDPAVSAGLHVPK
ncbi:MAG: hypothetical protein KDC87_12570 [Planctomycetes bacterium]|nr:hypothetical protein [Planctomycetota bacterium]MCB9889303.1 hypothetical protein [Planctomycetota bacterium]